MTTDSNVLDLRQCPPGLQPHTYAYYRLRDLKPGDSVLLLTADDPYLLLHQVQHQLRNRLSWQIVEHDGIWETRVCERAGIAPVTLEDVLTRDHLRLDRLFVNAMQQVGAGVLAQATGTLRQFFAGLRRHIEVENEILVPALSRPADAPVAMMLREHDSILEQVVVIEELCDTQASAGELDTWLGLLAAALSKHEHREETLVFPQWELTLTRGDRPTLVEEVKRRLAPADASGG